MTPVMEQPPQEPLPSPGRCRALIAALRRGTVPEDGLGWLAVGLDRVAPAIHQELADVAAGGAGFKAVRGDYGAGKTFFGRWLQEQARAQGFATTEVQISETETPLHRMETVYRRMIEHLSFASADMPALRAILDGWLYTLEADIVQGGTAASGDPAALEAAVDALLQQRLGPVGRTSMAFAAVIRAYRRALQAGDEPTAEALIAWLGGQPHVAAQIRRQAGLKGEVDHFAAGSFLAALLLILRDQGLSGLVVVLDEVETLQRMRMDTREKGLNALRQWLDEVDAGHYPGLYLVVTGTPAFFDGPQGVARLQPLAQRLSTDFPAEARFDNMRAVQIRLQSFGRDQLLQVGRRVRELYLLQADAPDRVRIKVDDQVLAGLAEGIVGKLGGRTGIAPRLFLKKLVASVLDPVDQHPDFEPYRDFQLLVRTQELTPAERAGLSPDDPDLIDLDLDSPDVGEGSGAS